jgi:hypothetical protein
MADVAAQHAECQAELNLKATPIRAEYEAAYDALVTKFDADFAIAQNKYEFDIDALAKVK